MKPNNQHDGVLHEMRDLIETAQQECLSKPETSDAWVRDFIGKWANEMLPRVNAFIAAVPDMSGYFVDGVGLDAMEALDCVEAAALLASATRKID